MTANESGFDRIARLALGIVLLGVAWFFMGALGTTLAIIVGVLGLIMLATSAMGWCPIYAMFGISTCKVK